MENGAFKDDFPWLSYIKSILKVSAQVSKADLGFRSAPVFVDKPTLAKLHVSLPKTSCVYKRLPSGNKTWNMAG